MLTRADTQAPDDAQRIGGADQHAQRQDDDPALPARIATDQDVQFSDEAGAARQPAESSARARQKASFGAVPESAPISPSSRLWVR